MRAYKHVDPELQTGAFELAGASADIMPFTDDAITTCTTLSTYTLARLARIDCARAAPTTLERKGVHTW